MTSVLLIDDLPMTRKLMADLLREAGFELTAVAGLADLAGQARPDICLVELVRRQGNGFSLAASLCHRWSSDPPLVFLLSDRQQASDQHWAIARGLSGVIHRVHGRRDMLRQLADLMSDEPAIQPVPTAAKAPPDLVEDTQPDPVQQLARQVCIDLQQSLDLARQLSASDIEGQSRWLATFNEQVGAVDNALTFIPPGFGKFRLAVEPASALKTLSLMLALYQAVSLLAGDCSDDPLLEPQARCKARLRVLQARRGDAMLDELMRMGCGLYALNLPPGSGFGAQSVWTWLWQSARLRHCHERRTNEEWLKLFRLSTEATITDCQFDCDHQALDSAVLTPALRSVCGRSDVSYADLYELQVWLRLQAEPPVALRVATGSLAQSVMLPAHTSQQDIHEQLGQLQSMLESGFNDIQQLVRVLRRQSLSPLLSISAAQQAMLAAQLSRLPRPQECLLALHERHEQHDLICNEIRHELTALNEVANALKLSAIESVSLVLMQIYSVFAINPAIADVPAVMGQLRRAHLGLCLLLDQAAAWQTISRAGSLTERLYRLLDQLLALGNAVADQPGGYQATSGNDPVTAEWQKCRRINRRLRHLLAQAESSDSLHAVMSELLRAQNHLLQQMPAYQESP